MNTDLRDATNANCEKGGAKYTHFDKDGKLQSGLNPVIDHGFIQVGKIEIQPSETYTDCPDCARLNAELAITKTALQSGIKMISQLHEDCARAGNGEGKI